VPLLRLLELLLLELLLRLELLLLLLRLLELPLLELLLRLELPLLLRLSPPPRRSCAAANEPGACVSQNRVEVANTNVPSVFPIE